MIDPEEPKAIRFQSCDVPELPDLLQADIEAAHRQKQQRKQETLRWLEEHMGFQPFGVEW